MSCPSEARDKGFIVLSEVFQFDKLYVGKDRSIAFDASSTSSLGFGNFHVLCLEACVALVKLKDNLECLSFIYRRRPSFCMHPLLFKTNNKLSLRP